MVGMGPKTEGGVGGASTTGGVAGGVVSCFDDDGAEAVAPSIHVHVYMLMFRRYIHSIYNIIHYKNIGYSVISW